MSVILIWMFSKVATELTCFEYIFKFRRKGKVTSQMNRGGDWGTIGMSFEVKDSVTERIV